MRYKIWNALGFGHKTSSASLGPPSSPRAAKLYRQRMHLYVNRDWVDDLSRRLNSLRKVVVV